VLAQDDRAGRAGVPLEDDLDVALLGEDRHRPDLRVAAEQPQAGEVADGPRRAVPGARGEHAQVRLRELVEEPALVEQLSCARPDGARPDLKRRLSQALQHGHRQAGSPELGGEEQADRAGSGYDDVPRILWLHEK
jgi:hypothetical protein